MSTCRSFSRNALCNAIFSGLLAGLAASGAYAQDGQTSPQAMSEQVKLFNVPMQPAASALNAFAEQADITLVFSQDVVAGVSTKPLRGSYSVTEGLAKMLEGTRLSYQQVGESTVAISIGSSSDVAATVDTTTMDTIVVTGSRLSRASTEGAQEVRTYDRERIERSGQTTLTEFLATLPEVSLNSPESTFISTSVRLRGLPEGSALILVNGRRVQSTTGGSAAFGFFDLNLIPLGSIERVEVLPTGTSAVYGGDALAGIVNIILKKDFDGLELSAGYKYADNTDETNASFAAGWTDEKVSLSVIGSHMKRTPLVGADREITASGDFRRYGGADLRSPAFATPGNVYAISGNLPGLDAPYAGVPVGSTGVGLTPSDFIETAGSLNLGTSSFYSSLIPATERSGLYASGHYRFSDSLEAFAEIMYSNLSIRIQTSPPLVIQAVVPASNPFNPFGTAVRVNNLVTTVGNVQIGYDDRLIRHVVGARGRVGPNWDWEVAYSDSRDEGAIVVTKATNAARLAEALASSDPTTAFNPFIDGPQGSPELLASIFGEVRPSAFESRSKILNGFLRGSAMMLPAGSLDIVIGGEGERSKISSQQSGLTNASRTTRSVFLEARVPIFGSPAREVLTIQGAVRRDDYSDFGAKTTPQAGIEYRPIPDLLLRSTYGEGFRPPTLYNVYAPRTSNQITAIDPRRNNEVTPVTMFQGGNTNLQPTTGDSLTLGAVYSPRKVSGLSMSVTAWRLDFENAISLPDRQFIVDNEDIFPGRVVRAASTGGTPGQIISVDASYINFGATRQAGFDIAADWAIKTPIGEIRPAAAVTYMTRFRGSSIPGGPEVDRLSRANNDGVFAPRVKGNASVGWRPTDYFSASLSGRYIGKYTDFDSIREIGGIWYFDSALELKLGKLMGWKGTGLTSTRLSISATNLADKLPAYSTYFRGFDPYNYDLIGRTVVIRLSTEF